MEIEVIGGRHDGQTIPYIGPAIWMQGGEYVLVHYPDGSPRYVLRSLAERAA